MSMYKNLKGHSYDIDQYFSFKSRFLIYIGFGLSMLFFSTASYLNYSGAVQAAEFKVAQDESLATSNAVNRVNEEELRAQIETSGRRVDVLESKQTEILVDLATIKTNLEVLKATAEHREGLFDGIMAGVAVLLVEMALRGFLKAREILLKSEGSEFK